MRLALWVMWGGAIAAPLSTSAYAQITTTGRLLPSASQLQADEEAAQAEPEEEESPRSDAPQPTQSIETVPDDMPALEEGGRLDLICFGAGAANKATSGTVFGNQSGTVMGSRGGFATYGGSSSATIVGTRSQGFEDQVTLFVENGEGQLRMPRTMLPLIRGGNDGWFKLKSIEIKEHEITASIAVNIINNPKLRLDRFTGAISISGKAGDYTGLCQRFDPATAQRQF